MHLQLTAIIHFLERSMSAHLPNSSLPQHLELLTMKQLAEEFFGITVTALYCRRHRDPNSIPPAINIPHSKSPLFYRATVVEWFLSYEEKREIQRPSLQHKPNSPRKKGRSTTSERILARNLGISVKELRR
jgi:hypothetical protein